jgi:hypothetical protein
MSAKKESVFRTVEIILSFQIHFAIVEYFAEVVNKILKDES